MAEETTKTNKETKVESDKTAEKKTAAVKPKVFTNRPYKKVGFKRPPPEFKQKIISIRRVTRVMAGGRRFSFSVALIIGDKKGRVGVGMGKAADTTLAIGKAFNQAKKKLSKIHMNPKMSISYEIQEKFCSARVLLMPNKGKGIIAGSAVRDVLNLAGLKDVTGKILSRSKKKFNIAQATLKALKQFVS